MHAASFSAPRFAGKFVRTIVVGWGIFVALAPSGSRVMAASAEGRSGPGRISVTTQPPGAVIYVDGQASGKSPKEIEGLRPGRYFVRAELDGYRPAEAVVEISSSEGAQSIAFQLTSSSAARPAPVAETRPVAPAPAPPTPVAPVRMATPIPAPSVAAATPLATPTPRPAAVAPAPSEAPAPATDSDETIRGLVAAHLKSISDGDIDAYLRLCAAKVDLYDEGMQSRESIRRSRQKLKERWPVYEISNIRDVVVRGTDQSEVKRAAVTYDWNVSNPKTGKKASGTANDLLDFKQIAGQWQMVKARQNVDRKKGGGQ